MNSIHGNHQNNHSFRGIWHGCLIALVSGAVIAGLGYLFHLRLGHVWFSYAGLMAGLIAGALFCAFVIGRLRKYSRATHTRAPVYACDRANSRLTFPRFILGLIHYGIITGMATGLGVLAWIGAEDYALDRPLEGTVEIVLGGFVSVSIGLTAFHILLRAFEGE